jgi:hypothetical protein
MTFLRMNFFKGLFTTAEDWRKEQTYHIEKRTLHNRTFHTPGVVKGERDDFKATVAKNQRSIIVQPGYAVDGQGRDLYLDKPVEVPLGDDLTRRGRQGYIWIGYAEQQDDKRTSHLDQNQTDYAFLREGPIVKCTNEEPDNIERIELGRITFGTGKNVKDRINTSHVKYAGTKASGDLWVCVQSGEAAVDPAESMDFSDNDSPYIIEVLDNEEEALRAVYVANAFPVPSKEANDARIHCRIVSSVEQKKIVYHLYLKNVGKTRATVKYVVYRLNLSSMH